MSYMSGRGSLNLTIRTVNVRPNISSSGDTYRHTWNYLCWHGLGDPPPATTDHRKRSTGGTSRASRGPSPGSLKTRSAGTGKTLGESAHTEMSASFSTRHSNLNRTFRASALTWTITFGRNCCRLSTPARLYFAWREAWVFLSDTRLGTQHSIGSWEL